MRNPSPFDEMICEDYNLNWWTTGKPCKVWHCMNPAGTSRQTLHCLDHEFSRDIEKAVLSIDLRPKEKQIEVHAL